MLNITKRLYSRIVQKERIYHSVGEYSLLPKKLDGKVKFDPGLALQVSLSEYKEFLAGNLPSTRWPVSVYFRTDEIPIEVDGLLPGTYIWADEKITAEILGYSNDFGVHVHEVTPLVDYGHT